MTKILVSCRDCGQFNLTAADLTLMVCSHAPLSYYEFDCPRCPRCGREIRKPADEHVISLLMSGGVKATVWEVPDEALERHSGPPVGFDDVLDLHAALGWTDYLAPLALEESRR